MSGAARRRLVVEADGGSRGNPGVAGYGALVRDRDTGAILVELAQPLGLASNNVAEYSGLIAGLRAAIEIDPGATVLARMDSKLVVEQMSGRWKIKHEDMRRLALQARDLCTQLSAAGGSVDFEWVPRERNKDADALSNDAMDGKSVRRVHDGVSAPDEPADATGTEDVSSGEGGSREGLRLLLVQLPTDVSAAGPIGEAVARLVGDGARVVAPSGPPAAQLAEAIGTRTGATVNTVQRWAAPAGSTGPDEGVRAAYRALWKEGGTVVALTTRRGVLTVLADVLALPEDRFWALATAPGSLTAVEVWPDGTASVAFTNRTAHLH